MYHGKAVPGFPQHPHRGFETVTIVRRGYVDHADSLGAAARYGPGDVQWLTAGSGVVHSEMFPLLEKEKPNPLELFQIWLNLPASEKMAEPHFEALEPHPPSPGVLRLDGAQDRGDGRRRRARRARAPCPAAALVGFEGGRRRGHLEHRAGAICEVDPAARRGAYRPDAVLLRGPALKVGDHAQTKHAALTVRSDTDLELRAGDGTTEILLLQGQPIAEPVVQYGPFVMNREVEIQRAMMDYQRTRFGGWPWSSDDPVHGREEGRFAKHVNGEVERMPR